MTSHADATAAGGREEDRELRLIEAVEPFHGFALAAALQALFASGVYDALAAGEALEAHGIARSLGLQPARVEALLGFLAVEGVVAAANASARGEAFVLTERGRGYGEFRAWYELLIGGYGAVFAGLTEGLVPGGELPRRRGPSVAAGSAGISQVCSLPMVRRLLARLPAPPELILDVGCGSPEYLRAICADSNCRGIGVEPDRGAVDEGRRRLAETGDAGRIDVVQGDAATCFDLLDVEPDVVITAFVLHEVLGQSGEEAVRAYLRRVFAAAPAAYLLVIEVDLRQRDPSVMQHGYARRYYNGYYLLHPFTDQRLAPRAYWEELFESEGLQIAFSDTTDSAIDSTGLELGYLLRRAP